MSKRFTFKCLSESDGSWSAFIADWERQCDAFNEEIDQFAAASIPVLQELANAPEQNAQVYSLVDEDNSHHSVVQLNRSMLPKTYGWTLRARHLILSPKYDFGEYSIDDYADAIGSTLFETVRVARDVLPSDHIKFHLRSPADRPFFTILSSTLSGVSLFSDVSIVGAWLSLTLADRASGGRHDEAD